MISYKLSILAAGSLLATFLAAAPVRAYINGGDYKKSGGDLVQKLKEKSWFVGTFELRESPEKEQIFNLLVARAVQALPKKDAERITLDDKQKIAKAAKAELDALKLENVKTLKEGRVGAFRYQIGVDQFSGYWETNYGGKRETHAHTSRFIPFVAIKLE